MTPTAESTARGRPYPLDNDKSQAEAQHLGLATLLNPPTFARINQLVGDLTGKRCLEVGAGGGSVALWLAEQVGPTGHVTATDLKPGRIPAHERLEVLQHDLTKDPIPHAGTWDVIHARLVLNHLPSRLEILHRLAQSLAPGGVLINEDWATDQVDEVAISAPTPVDADLYNRYQQIMGEKVFTAAGTDRSWARNVHVVMLNEGLVDVTTEVSACYWKGGEISARMVAGNIRQVWDRLLAAGMTTDELERVLELLEDPRMVIHGFPLYSAAGWRRA